MRRYRRPTIERLVFDLLDPCTGWKPVKFLFWKTVRSTVNVVSFLLFLYYTVPGLTKLLLSGYIFIYFVGVLLLCMKALETVVGLAWWLEPLNLLVSAATLPSDLLEAIGMFPIRSPNQ